ncbi:MAG: radical SAM protein [Proteobacteria bacterium]|nr:radical SAM protein [Pseudomonadota bacterium]MBU4287868.1 radical SAM protein [Pseudomonadota bacterium]MBU4413989.1 radical SAM protein [Pseudomonadota bacterium]MCG2757233.1 radical SAM protein [Desulfobacteraceae bacterium]
METAQKPFNSVNSFLKIRFGPDGLHFFNRKTGINILVNEIIPPNDTWSSAPRQVSVALTNTCDLNCPHCYAPKSPGILDFDLVTSWLSDLDANGCIGVGFGGGEPTLYPKLAELCSFTAKKTNLAIIMTTHAHRLNDQFLNELKGNLHFVRVSMDGVGSTYESIRCRPFETLLERIRALSRITAFGINYVVNSKTIKDIDSAANLAAELGAAEFLLIPEVSVRRGSGIDNDTVIKLQSWVSNYHGAVPLTVSEGGAEGLPTCNPFEHETGLASFAHIDAFGVMKRTSYDTSGIHIYEDGVIAALNKLKAIVQEMA